MTTSDEGSVTHWIAVLKAGDERAAGEFWHRYFTRLVYLARAKLSSARRPDAAVDEEEIALSAFDSFCAGAALGRFPAITDRDEIAGRLGCAGRTVARQLKLIRTIWENASP